MRIIYIDRTDSTNEEAKRVPPIHGLCIVAREQTGGRGRRGRRWLSERDKGLYASFVLRKPEKNLGILSLAFGYSTFVTLSKLCEGFYLKWPNDVYFNGKKVAGILLELLKDRLIVGIGINLTYSREELSQFPVPATSLTAEGISFNRELLINNLYDEVMRMYERLEKGKFGVEEFEKNCPMLGREILVIEGEKKYRGRAIGIGKNGTLIVETEDGIRELHSGDVSVREERWR